MSGRFNLFGMRRRPPAPPPPTFDTSHHAAISDAIDELRAATRRIVVEADHFTQTRERLEKMIEGMRRS